MRCTVVSGMARLLLTFYKNKGDKKKEQKRRALAHMERLRISIQFVTYAVHIKDLHHQPVSAKYVG